LERINFRKTLWALYIYNMSETAVDVEKKYEDNDVGRKQFKDDLLTKYNNDADKDKRNLIEVWNDWWDKHENHNETRGNPLSNPVKSSDLEAVNSSDLEENRIKMFTSVFEIYLYRTIELTVPSRFKNDYDFSESNYDLLPDNVTHYNFPTDFFTTKFKVIEPEAKFDKFKSAYDGWNKLKNEKKQKEEDIVYNLILRRVFPADREKLCNSVIGTHIVTSILATVSAGSATIATLSIAAPALIGLASIGAGPGGLVLVVFLGGAAIIYGFFTKTSYNYYKRHNARIREGVKFGGNDGQGQGSGQQFELKILPEIPDGTKLITKFELYNDGRIESADDENMPPIPPNPEIEKKLRDPKTLETVVAEMPPIPEQIRESAHLKMAREVVADFTKAAIQNVMKQRPDAVAGGKTRRRPKRKRSKTKRNQKKSNKRRT